MDNRKKHVKLRCTMTIQQQKQNVLQGHRPVSKQRVCMGGSLAHRNVPCISRRPKASNRMPLAQEPKCSRRSDWAAPPECRVGLEQLWWCLWQPIRSEPSAGHPPRRPTWVFHRGRGTLEGVWMGLSGADPAMDTVFLGLSLGEMPAHEGRGRRGPRDSSWGVGWSH